MAAFLKRDIWDFLNARNMNTMSNFIRLSCLLKFISSLELHVYKTVLASFKSTKQTDNKKVQHRINILERFYFIFMCLAALNIAFRKG